MIETIMRLLGKRSMPPHPKPLHGPDIPEHFVERKKRLEAIIRQEARLIEELGRQER